MSRPQPAYVADDPMMAGAFASFVQAAFKQDEMHAAFCEATGRKRIGAARSPLDLLVDQATKVHEDYVEAFVAWLIREHWGEEGDPRMEDAEP